jgi:hypothetical protein
MNPEMVTIVSGLPRSGTSMMMRMLEAGGMQVLTDNIRGADEDNPKGYYEFQRVKKTESDPSWVEGAQGKVVKMISALLKYLPQDYTYKTVFMRRHLGEILASQREMLIRRGEPTDAVSDEKMAEMFRKHLESVDVWVDGQKNMEILHVSYNDVLKEPAEQVNRINHFFGNELDAEKMVAVVDGMLYRQRR